MSLHSQSQLLGQPYAAPYAHPGMGYHYTQPSFPPPTYHVDPNTFRQDYSLRLTELTINSRPIIQNLSMLAQEFARFAEIVTQCIDAHIRRVPTWMKLPAFYLLDAISKNVFEPYSRHFSTLVVPLFLDTYKLVDQSIRSKMEEMLLTWRTGAPNGRELFGLVPQVAIERGIWGSEPNSTTDSINGYYNGSGQISKSQVLSELEFTLGQNERSLQANPYDSVSQNNIHVLQQLQKLVEAGSASQADLRQILGRLRAFSRTTVPPPLPPGSAMQSYPIPPPPHASSSQTPLPIQTSPSFPPGAGQPLYPQPHAYHHPPIDPHKIETVNQSLPISGAPPNPEAISVLFDSLVKAGIVAATGTAIGASTSAKEPDHKPSPVDFEREASRSYRKSILAQKIKLTSADISKTRPQIVHFLYTQLPTQCKQCGIRFADTVVGKKMIEEHLDMHFRQNRKANQNIGRGHSRSWFVAVDDWIRDSSTNRKKEGRAGGRRPLNAKAAAAAEVAKREAELRAQYVVVPPGDEAKPISCPVCKEALKSEFLEDDEDWVWKNAVKKDDRIFHATCYAEAVTSTSSLAARLRTEFAHRSRSGTPDGRSTPRPVAGTTLKVEIKKSLSPPPEPHLVGTKRKRIENDSTLSDEANLHPPLKKLTLSSF